MSLGPRNAFQPLHRRHPAAALARQRSVPQAALLALCVGLALPLTPLPAPAQGDARGPSATSPARPTLQITGMEVQPAAQLEPGAEIGFSVWGTPAATVTVSITGAQRSQVLMETRPGRYEGVFTLSQRDRVAPNAQVSVAMRRGDQIATALLTEPLQKGWTPPPAATAPRIDKFTLTQGGSAKDSDRRQRTLLLRVEGTPGGRASVMLPGAQNRRIRLAEQPRGVYTGAYAISDDDQLQANADATAYLQVGEQRTELVLPRALANVKLPPARWQMADCLDCGVITAINKVEVRGDASPVGAVAGGVIGGLLGNQIGGGDGRKVATVAGAVGGAVVGHQIAKDQADRRSAYEVAIRMGDGSELKMMQDTPPAMRVGDAVRIVEGQLRPLPQPRSSR